ncbi:MAG: recombination protein RecR [Bacteroidaceae bacterium]|nr:recombination protein RecR [Bacteroidaceae bacterium]
MEIPSLYLERAVSQFAGLPGIGRKTAMRLVLHLLKRERTDVDAFADSLKALMANVHYCRVCHNICDGDICSICATPSRDHSTVCVVESIQDVMAIEATQQFNGVYHVLGGVISPMDGIGPQDLEIISLVERVAQGGIREVILALSPTMEGDTTDFYIYRKLADYEVDITTIARGVAQNDLLHYTDEVTLGRSILDRRPFGVKSEK